MTTGAQKMLGLNKLHRGNEMTEKIIQTDLDNLADIIWWIKGYIAGAGDLEECPFGMDHHESLRKARVVLKYQIKAKK